MISYPSMQGVARTGRTPRRPQHPFNIKHRPYVIQPFFIAPVLPGETMKNLLLQARVVSDPLKSPLIGWWIEYYFFYVKFRDMDEKASLTEMVLDPAFDTSGMNEAANIATYHAGTGLDFVKMCLKPVVREYFRDDTDDWNTYLLDGMPLASINQQSWLDSVFRSADYVQDEQLIPVDAVPAPDVVKASDIEKAMRLWELSRLNNLTTQTYEEFLATYGIRQQQQDLLVPELLRYVREWTYPSNTINPSDGAPASAVSWAIAERADKDRFFAEPGFVFGVSVARPKVYLSGQKGSATWALKDAFAWLPAVLQNDPAASQRLIAQGAGPLPAVVDAGGYYVDVRDLFIYGDQFCNYDMTGGSAPTDTHLVPLPTTALNKRFITVSADIDALFKNIAPANKIKQDGIVTMTVLGRQVDHTPTVNYRV